MASHARIAPDEFKVSASSVNSLPLFVHFSFFLSLPSFFPACLPSLLPFLLPSFFPAFLPVLPLSFHRHYGQEMVKMLLNHQECKMLLERSVPARDLEDILRRIKKKVSAWQEKCLLCASIATANRRSNIPNLS